jgi:hypothetical protein
VADEVIVDEHGGVDAVDDDGGLAAAPFGADVDGEVVEEGDAVGDDAVAGSGRPGWCGDAVGGGLSGGVGLPATDRCDASDALVGTFVVVGVAEVVELGLQFGEVGGEWLTAQPLLEGLLESFTLPVVWGW